MLIQWPQWFHNLSELYYLFFVRKRTSTTRKCCSNIAERQIQLRASDTVTYDIHDLVYLPWGGCDDPFPTTPDSQSCIILCCCCLNEAKGPGVFVVLLEALYCPWIREKSLPIKAILVFRPSMRVSVNWISEWMNMSENDHTPIAETIHPPAYPAGLELIPVEGERVTGGRHETFDLHAQCWKCGHIMRLYILGPDNGGGETSPEIRCHLKKQ